MEPKANPPVFLDLLQETLNNEDKEREKKGPREFRHNPSSASFKRENGTVVGACLRQLYWRATNEPESNARDFTSRLQGLFGNSIHDAINAVLAKCRKIRTEPEAPGRVTVDELSKEISFRIDNLVTYQGEDGFLEIKSVQSFAVQRMVKEGGPKPKDILQCLSYFGTNENLRWCSLVYVGRDNAFRAEYHIYKDPETGRFVIEGKFPKQKAVPLEFTFKGIVARWKELEAKVAKKELPDRDFKAVLDSEGKVVDRRQKHHVVYETDPQCKYCSYKTKCWSLPDAQEASRKVGNV